MDGLLKGLSPSYTSAAVLFTVLTVHAVHGASCVSLCVCAH